MNQCLLFLCTAALTGLPLATTAQTVPIPSGVLNLGTSASIEVTKDVLGVTFSVTRDGSDAQSVQSALKFALDAALAEARKIAKPGQVDVQTGNFSLYPRYGTAAPRGGNPVISSWQGSTELIVQGKDAAAIAQLTGRVSTMTIARVGYSLSRDVREKVEGEAVAQAIAQWRAKAQLMSQQFGYAGYSVREVNVTTNEVGGGPMLPMLRAKAMSAADEALPIEAGKTEVTATVNGSVQMLR